METKKLPVLTPEALAAEQVAYPGARRIKFSTNEFLAPKEWLNAQIKGAGKVLRAKVVDNGSNGMAEDFGSGDEKRYTIHLIVAS